MALFPQTKSSKFFWGVGLVAVALFLFGIGYNYYDQWRGERRVEQLAEALRQIEQEIYNKKAADTTGGKTPQETLDLFITAVEKGDYELASKYFVIEKQEEELKSLQNSKKENVHNVMGLLKQAKNTSGEYSFDKKGFSFYQPILVNFILYPSGNWKIEEI
jgi:hypothetical protein